MDRCFPLLVVAPLQDEAESICRRLAEKGIPWNPGQAGTLTCSLMPSLDMIVAVGGVGKAQFALQAQHLLDHRRETRLLICTGGAGQLSPDLAVGDVVVGTHTIEHDYRERFNPRPLPRYDSDAAVLAQLQEVAASHDLGFRVHFGPIASGDEDIVDLIRRAEVHEQTGALCVAWEGSGAARAARFSGVGFVEVRVITDAADEGAADSFHANLERVMAHVADLLAAWRVSSPQAM